VVLVVLAVGVGALRLAAAAAEDDGDGVLVYCSCCLGTVEALGVKNEANTKFGVTRVCSAHSRTDRAARIIKRGSPALPTFTFINWTSSPIPPSLKQKWRSL
jgi:hypothetical protein